jgi:putative zinc finger protein
MDHKDVVRLKATERYLLNELDPDQLDQFEEHLFDCQECALDVRAAAMFVEQGKNILSEPATSAQEARTKQSSKNWFAWLRPAFAVPVMALLLVVVGYQNLVQFPGIRTKADLPEVMPSVTMNIATRGADVPVISARQGQDFSILLNLPPDGVLTSYIADLYNAAGTVKWSLAIPTDAVVNDSVSVRVPGSRLATGTYVLAVRRVPRDGGSPAEIGRHSFELRLP